MAKSGLPAFDAPRSWRKGEKLPKTAGQKAQERREAIEKAVAKRNEERCEATVKRSGKKRRCDMKTGHFGTAHKSRVEADGHVSFVWWDSVTREVWFEDYTEDALF